MHIDNRYSLLIDIIESRYSCRSYSTEHVNRDTLLAVLESARLAPSACNKQPWVFIVADSQETRDIITAAYNREWVKNVPSFIIACGDRSQGWHRADGKDHTDIDVAIAVEHICLAAASLGLGSCWICNFDTKILTTSLSIPENLDPVAIIPIGYPEKDAAAPQKNRKDIDAIVKWGKF